MIRNILIVVALAYPTIFVASAISTLVAAQPVLRMARCGAKDALRAQPSVVVAVRRPPYCVEV